MARDGPPDRPRSRKLPRMQAVEGAPRRVGLTGGIASGKSAVAELLRARGAVVVDADVLAREVVEPGTPGLGAIVGRFGPGVLLPDGTLDRPALGEIVFADAAARAALNAIVHPAVRVRAAEIEAAAGEGAVVVHVIPLLVETGQADRFDTVVVVDADEATQVRRLRARNDLTEEQAHARLAAQASRAERLAVADVVIDNTGAPTALVPQVEALWARLTPVTDARVYLEDGVGMAYERGAAAWSFALGRWGWCAQGRTPADALAAVADEVGDFEVAERIHGDEQAFARDLEPATEAEVWATLQTLTAARRDLLALLDGVSDAVLDWDDPARELPGWASWRTLRQMARHIADTESRSYLPALGLPGRPRVPDLKAELAASAAHVRATVLAMPRDAVRQADGERWTSVKLLRRLAWHERGEVAAMAALVAGEAL